MQGQRAPLERAGGLLGGVRKTASLWGQERRQKNKTNFIVTGTEEKSSEIYGGRDRRN